MLIFMIVEVTLLFLSVFLRPSKKVQDVVAIIVLGYCILVIHFLCERFRDECLQDENLRLNREQNVPPQYVQQTVDLPSYAESLLNPKYVQSANSH